MSTIKTERRTGGGRPQTIATITASGRERFLAYIDALEAVVRDVQRSTLGSPRSLKEARADG